MIARPKSDTVFAVVILATVAVAFMVVGRVEMTLPAPPSAPAPAPGVPVAPGPQVHPPPASVTAGGKSLPVVASSVARQVRWGSCTPAPPSLVKQIMVAVIDPDVTATGRAAYRPLPDLGASLVAVELVDGQVGVWARDGSALLYAVDEVAQQSTGWPPAELSQLDLAPDHPVVAATKLCLA